MKAPHFDDSYYKSLAVPHGQRIPAGHVFFRWVLYVLSKVLAHVETPGMECMPPEGPLILAFNHIHYLDPYILAGILPRYNVPISKIENFEIPVIGWTMIKYGVIPVRRGEVDRKAIRTALEVLRAGNVFVIAPEGTRSKDHRLQRPKGGIGYIAAKSGAPIQPVGVIGTPEFPGAYKRLRRPHVVYRFGPVFRLRGLPGRLSPEVLEQIGDEVMIEIARLLPEEMRGVYANALHREMRWLVNQKDCGRNLSDDADLL